MKNDRGAGSPGCRCKAFGVLAAWLGMMAAILAPAPAGACPIGSDTNVVFYGQTGAGGVGALSRSWILHFLEWWKSHDATLRYVELDGRDIAEDCVLSDYPALRIYIQPGGDAYKQQNTLGSDGRANILSFVDNGGAYVGICAGFYYASEDYIWQGQAYDWPDLLGRFPTVEGSIVDIADYEEPPGYALTPVSGGQVMIYYGGPTRGWRDTDPDFPGESLQVFSALPGNIPAVIRVGNLLLSSVHPEAFEGDGIDGLGTEQRTDNYIWFANAINQTAGTGFFVPGDAPPAPPTGLTVQ